TELGYQPTGIRPCTPSLPPAAMRTTATSLSPAFATYSFDPSADTDRPSGFVPTGAPRYGASDMVCVTASVDVSITDTEWLSWFATYSASVFGLSASALGCSPTVILPVSVLVAVSTTSTVFLPQSDTYAFEPSCDSVTAYGNSQAVLLDVSPQGP